MFTLQTNSNDIRSHYAVHALSTYMNERILLFLLTVCAQRRIATKPKQNKPIKKRKPFFCIVLFSAYTQQYSMIYLLFAFYTQKKCSNLNLKTRNCDKSNKFAAEYQKCSSHIHMATKEPSLFSINAANTIVTLY